MRGGTTSGGLMPRAAAALVLAGIGLLLGATATAGAVMLVASVATPPVIAM